MSCKHVDAARKRGADRSAKVAKSVLECPYRVNSVQACRLKYGQGLKLVF